MVFGAGKQNPVSKELFVPDYGKYLRVLQGESR
jgi:hypothetical protein